MTTARRAAAAELRAAARRRRDTVTPYLDDLDGIPGHTATAILRMYVEAEQFDAVAATLDDTPDPIHDRVAKLAGLIDPTAPPAPTIHASDRGPADAARVHAAGVGQRAATRAHLEQAEQAALDADAAAYRAAAATLTESVAAQEAPQ